MGGIFFNSGELTIDGFRTASIGLAGGAVNNSEVIRIDGDKSVSAAIRLYSNGEFNNQTLAILQIDDIDELGAIVAGAVTNTSFSNKGRILFGPNKPVNKAIDTEIGITNGGEMFFTDATIGITSATNFTNNPEGTLIVPQGSQLQIDGTLVNEGTLTNNGTITNNGTFTNNGITNGSGIFSTNFINPTLGTVSPGTSPDCLTFNNGYTNNGTLEIELADGSPCTDFDQIIVQGDAIINGDIIVSFLSGTPTSTSFIAATASGTLTANPNITWPPDFTGTYHLRILSASPIKSLSSPSKLPLKWSIRSDSCGR